MDTNIYNKIRVFSDEFVNTIIEGNEPKNSGYEWVIEFYSIESMDRLNTTTILSLYDSNDEKVGYILYEHFGANSDHDVYFFTLTFGSVSIKDVYNVFDFKKLMNIIDEKEDGLALNMFWYMRDYAQQQIKDDVEAVRELAPRYKR